MKESSKEVDPLLYTVVRIHGNPEISRTIISPKPLPMHEAQELRDRLQTESINSGATMSTTRFALDYV